MKKTIKIFSFLLAFSMIFTTLTGCGGKGDANSKKPVVSGVNDEFVVSWNFVEHTEGTVAYEAGGVRISDVIVANREYYFYVDDGGL